MVRDSGIGIPDAQLTNHNGTLGIQLIRTLVKQIDADMKIETDDGTKFCITFDLPPEMST